MTMPDERTRSLRFGWEFLLELQAADNLLPDQRIAIDLILRHYPSSLEIAAWAAADSLGPHNFGPRLEPETIYGGAPPAMTIEHQRAGKRGITSPSQRTNALMDAFKLFRALQTNATNLAPEQRRQIPYVLRHFPDTFELLSWTSAERRRKTKDPGYRVWLWPPESREGDST